MKKIIIIIVALGLILGAGYFLLPSGNLNVFAGETAPVSTVEAEPVKASRDVIAEAKVVPVRYAALSIPVSGIVQDVLVKEQDQILGGQILVYLQNGRERAAVAEAEAALEAARAYLDELKAGARAQEIDSAQAELDAAQAEVDRLRESARAEDLAAAEAVLAGAQAALDDLLDGPDKDELARTAADRANAEAALQRAQFEYDQVKWDAGIQARPEAVQLQQATNEYEVANTRYDELVKGASEAELTAAKAKVREAKAELNRVKSPARESEIAAAEARARRAQASLDLLKAGTRNEQIRKAGADVKAAEAALVRARVALSETELRAPFAGVVASIDARVGEPITQGNTVVRLADVSTWQIETDDLTEIEVVDVREGAPVTISFDAIPDLELSGKVLRIKPFGEEKQGDMTYTVLIQPDQQDARLRWNMTATVRVTPEEKDVK